MGVLWLTPTKHLSSGLLCSALQAFLYYLLPPAAVSSLNLGLDAVLQAFTFVPEQ